MNESTSTSRDRRSPSYVAEIAHQPISVTMAKDDSTALLFHPGLGTSTAPPMRGRTATGSSMHIRTYTHTQRELTAGIIQSRETTTEQLSHTELNEITFDGDEHRS